MDNFAKKRRNYWEDQHVLQINREPMHVPLGAYSDEAEAATCNRSISKYVLSLNGTWKFKLFANPSDVPEGFYKDGYDVSGWDDIQVPGSWELQGYSYPIYTNILYPFDMNQPDSPHIQKPSCINPDCASDFEVADFCRLKPPFVPRNNPTGCYVTCFTVPDWWRGREVFINFDGVESAFYLWINGEFAGYSQDSKLCAEFNISPYLRQGKNILAVQVMRWSDGFYLEDQDYWHLSGIQRPVTLYSKPRIHIRDFKVITLLDDQYRDARLVVYCYVNKSNGFADYSIKARLLDASGKDCIPALESKISVDTPMYAYSGFAPEAGAALLMANVEAPRKWNAENPYLYTLLLTLVDPQGRETDFESCRVGFRRVEINSDGVVTLNGKRLIIRGVDRHEHHPETGRYVTEERMRQEIMAMKRLNFNAVRTSHYPNDPKWYDLCDELGIYLVDETNLETHGVQALLSKDPEWAGAYLDRAVRMVMRDKNHPSIIFWSLGNESGAGANHAAMAGWIRHYDPYRPVQYESGYPGPLISDIKAPMYPNLSWVAETLTDIKDKRPIIMCEYAYSKSNSNGNVKDFWDFVDRFPRFQGGFVWDWCDKALIKYTEDGKKYWAYGGDFGEPLVDPVPDMCLNGVVLPDLTPKPGAYEIKKVQAPVAVYGHDVLNKSFEVFNKHLELSLSYLDIFWEVTENGKVLQKGVLEPLNTPAGAREIFTIPFDLPEAREGCEYFINISFRLGSDTPWASKGHEIYGEQFALLLDVPHKPVPDSRAEKGIVLNDSGRIIEISGQDMKITFDKDLGVITFYTWKGVRIINTGLIENYFRAPTGIDEATGGDRSIAEDWRRAGLDRLERSLEKLDVFTMGKSRVCIEISSYLCAKGKKNGIRSGIRYIIHGDGTIEVENMVDASPALPILPRIGVTFTVPGKAGKLQWFGRGPHENYPDRKCSAHVGLYTSTVDEQHFPFILPVECGGKEDVRWFTLTDEDGFGIKVEGYELFHFDVHRNSVQEYYAAKHTVDLKLGEDIWVNVDHKHSGLGGDTGWSKNIHEEYQVKPGRYQYSFKIRPLG